MDNVQYVWANSALQMWIPFPLTWKLYSAFSWWKRIGWIQRWFEAGEVKAGGTQHSCSKFQRGEVTLLPAWRHTLMFGFLLSSAVEVFPYFHLTKKKNRKKGGKTTKLISAKGRKKICLYWVLFQKIVHQISSGWFKVTEGQHNTHDRWVSSYHQVQYNECVTIDSIIERHLNKTCWTHVSL